MRFPVPILIVVVAVSAQPAAAQRLESRPVPSRGVESFYLDSPSMGVRFAINVGLPIKIEPGKKYPALIQTDGDFAFPGTYDPARSLMEGGAIGGLFVISIGTSFAEGDSTWTRRRIYEFSPPNWNRTDAFGKGVSSYCEAFHSPPGKCTGGAPALLHAIVAELIPAVAAKYPIDRDDLGLFGISAGGFFASWAIFQAESPFKRYIISSPAMAYGDGEIYRQEERYAATHKDLPARIYFAVGGLETGDPSFEGIGQIVSGTARLVGLLATRKYPGLTVYHELHPGMSHGDVMGTVVVRGLRMVYGK